MHHLNRSDVATPQCLLGEHNGRQYEDLSGAEKAQIRNALLQIQGNRCAYCERRTGDRNNDGHIEHFRKQADHQELDLSWNNLYWSCNDESTCGKHKDKCNLPHGRTQRCFSPDDIISPGDDDPEVYMEFISDGSVRPRPGLTGNEQRRYEETVRVFQIADSALLRKSRQDSTKPYISALDALRRAGPELFMEYILREIDHSASAPFATAIRHFLRSHLQ